MSEITPFVSGDFPGKEEEAGGDGLEKDAGGGLSDAQRELLERCLHSLKHGKTDSQTLAALLLVSVSHQGYIAYIKS